MELKTVTEWESQFLILYMGLNIILALIISHHDKFTFVVHNPIYKKIITLVIFLIILFLCLLPFILIRALMLIYGGYMLEELFTLLTGLIVFGFIIFFCVLYKPKPIPD